MAKKMTFTADDFRGKSSNATFTAEDFRHDPFEKIREQEQAAAREAAIKRLYEQRNAPAKKMDGMNIVAAPTNPAQNQPTGGPTLASLGGAASMVRPATPQPAHTYTSAQHYLSSTRDLAYKIAEEKAAEEKRKAEQWYADKAKAAEDYAGVSANADFQKMAAEGQKKTRTTESGFGASSIPEAFTADRMGALDRHRAYTDLSDDQKLVYDYYIGKGDSQSANAYLEAIRPQINAQRAEKRQAEAEAYAAEHPVLASVKSTVMSPLNIVPAASTFVDKLSDSLTGEYNPIDPNADVFAGVQTSRALRQKVSQDIAGGENATLPRKLASFGYDTMMSVADMATAAAVGGIGGIGAGGTLLAGGGMGNTLYDMKKDGASDTEAGQMAMLTGLAEWFSESRTFSRLEDVIARGSESLLSNMAKEGGEEVFTELVESLGELSIREDESKLAKIYNSYIAGGASHGEAFMKTVGQELKQMGLAFAGGALAGGLGEAGAYGMYALNTMADGNDIKANAEAVAAITEQAKSAPESNTAKKLEQITGKYGSVEKAPGFAVGKLAQVYYEDVQMEEQLAQEQAAAEYGDNVANVLRVAAEESARAVVQGDAGAENAPNLPVNEQRVDNSTPAPVKSASEALSKPAEASGVVSDSDAVVKETGEPVIVDKVASVENGTVYVEVTTNDGKVTMKADDVAMSSPAAEMVRESKYYSTARSANAFLEDYPAGVPVRNYMNAHKGMYLAGLSGEDFQKSLGYVSSFGIDEGILRLAYKYGEMDAKEIREGKKAPKKKQNAGVQESNAATRLRESSEQAKAELDAVDRITKALGISVEVHDHVEGANGYYHASGTIVLSADAFTGEYATKGILQIFAHELTHNLEDSSPEAWKKYRDFVVNYYRENDAVWFEDRMQKLEQLYEAAGKQITHEQILNEMAANATEEFLFDEAAVKALVKEDRPLAKKILGMIQDVITKLRSIMKGYKANSPEVIHLKQSVAAYTEARRLWVEAIGESAELNVKPGEATVIEKDGTEIAMQDMDGNVRFNLSTREESTDQLNKWLKKMVAYREISKRDADDIKSFMNDMYDAVEAMAKDESLELPMFQEWQSVTPKVNANGEVYLSVVSHNSEYPMNLDFSRSCVKRTPMNHVLNKLIGEGRLDVLNMRDDDFVKIRRILEQYNLTITCSGCYVENKRFLTRSWAVNVSNAWNRLVKAAVGDGTTDVELDSVSAKVDTINTEALEAEVAALNAEYRKEKKTDKDKAGFRNMAEVIKAYPELRHTVNAGMLISPEQFDKIAQHHPKLWGIIRAHDAQGTPYAVIPDAVYAGDILAGTDADGWDRMTAYKIGGVRLHARSDYKPKLFLDYCQMFADLAAKKLPAHDYTKVPNFIKLFGLTGMKHNMSMFGEARATASERKHIDDLDEKKRKTDPVYQRLVKNAGLDENGQYTLSKESFPLAEGLAIQSDPEYSKYCGFTAVGLSVNHVWALLHDRNIKMVIPFHASGINPVEGKMTNVDLNTDFTREQNTVKPDEKSQKRDGESYPEYYARIAGRETKAKDGSIIYNNGKVAYGKKDDTLDFNFYDDLVMTDDPVQTAKNYVEACQNSGLIPKYPTFVYNPDGSFNRDYYKLLTDFTLYDVDGNYCPQEPVSWNKDAMPDNWRELMLEGLREEQAQQNRLDDNIDEIADEVMEAIGRHDNAARYSLVEYDHDISQYMTSRNWADVDRVIWENVRNEANVVTKASCGDFIIPSGEDLVYTSIKGDEVIINQIIHVDVDEKSQIEDTYHQIVFDYFRKDYENGKYGETSIEEFAKDGEYLARKALGRTVDVSIYSKPNYRSNRRDGLAAKENSRRRAHYHFGDEQDGGRDSSQSGENVRESLEEVEHRKLSQLMKQNARLQELNTELKRQLKITKEYTPKAHVLKGMARGFLRDYNSTYSQEQLEHDLDGLFRYIANAENIDNMHVSETAQIIARRILDESRMLDTTMQDQYGDLLSRLKRTKITVSKQDQGDFGVYGGFGAFKRQYRGKLNIVAEGGISVDALYQELADQYPELFDTDQYTAVSDQLMNLADTIDACKPQYVNDYFMNNDEAVAMLAHEIYDRYSLTALNSPTFADRKKAELTRVRNQYKAKIETTKKEYRDKHKATLAKVREENREKIKKLKSAQNTATKDMVKDFNRQIKALENTHLQDLKAQEKRFAEERKQAIKQAKAEQREADRKKKAPAQPQGKPIPVHANSDAATEKALQVARDDFGIIEPGERRAREVNVPRSVEEGTKVRRFARTVMESGSVTDEMVDGIEKEILNGGMSYEPLSNAALYSKAERMVKANPESALASWKNIMNSGGIPNAADIALGEALLKYYADAGDAKMVVELTTDIAAAGTRAGQSVQALRILKSLTEVKGSEYLGDLAYIKKTVDLMNKDLVKRKRKPGEAPVHLEINQDLAEKLAMATTAEEREAICGEIYQDLADQLPTTWVDKWNAWRYLAMLGNPRTHMRNLFGNGIFIPAVTMKNVVGAALESAMGTKEKTKSVSVAREYKEYAAKDYKKIKDLITSDGKHNPKSEITSRQKIFKTKWLEWIRENNFKLLEMEDGAFLQYHYVSAMAQYMQSNHVDINTVEGNEALLQRARNYAIAEAQKATYRDASKAAQAISNLGKESPALGFFVEGVLPFKKTPINVLKRGVEYSPIGLLDAISRKSMRLHRGEITVNEWIDSVASGLTGTAIVALGAFLASLGFIRGGYDEEKEKLEKLQGYQEYAIHIGDHSYTVDWAAPASMPLFIGVEMWNAIGGAYDEKTFAKIFDALTHITEPMFNLSMLDGLNSTIEAVSYADNKLTALGTEALTSYLGQAVPSVLGQVARTIDPKVRKTYTDKNSAVPKDLQYFLQKVMNKIPMLSFVNQPMLNQWGEEYENGNVLTRALENFLSPGYYERASDDMVELELSDLYDQTLEGGVIPQSAAKYFSVNGERVDLTAEQYTQYQRVVGQSAYSILDEMIQNEGYDKLTPAAQVDVVKMVYEYSKAVGKLTLYEEYEAESWIQKFYKAYQADGTSVADMILARAGYISVIDAGDVATANEYIDLLVNSGIDKSTIRSAITREFKEAYLAADKAERKRLEKILKQIVIRGGKKASRYTDSDFQKWLNE